MDTFLIYGANGYTGSLIAREAVQRGLQPVLAGRNAAEIAALAAELKLAHRTFALDDSAAVDEALGQVSVVLHCAGPFRHTYKPMVESCLRTRTHYLDITGEIEVFEAIARRDEEAKAKNVMLLPGAGFDVVPSDCLAAHLKQQLPAATHLALAFASSGQVSRGTATTILENFPRGGMVRQNGELKRVPAAWKTREVDFGRGPLKVMTIPWGDVATAYYSTGIGNTETYVAVPRGTRMAAYMMRYFGWLMGMPVVQRFMKKRIRTGAPGPNAEERARGWSRLWGEVTDDAGNRAVSQLKGPEGYTFTVRTALAIVQRVLAGQAPSGFRTPSLAYGPDLVLEIEGVERV